MILSSIFILLLISSQIISFDSVLYEQFALKLFFKVSLLKVISNAISFAISFAESKPTTKYILLFSSYLFFIFFPNNVKVSLLSNPIKFNSWLELTTILFLLISSPIYKS